ncbi:dj-1 protein-like protein [Coemansia reversa NRRL 1564]|uniref:D-lactate dehydratase n=1 Tax=Coemansia reversa (strain ATCC 12441 / NRRL 1564) TaxID=763665 RepID=A0A2G5B8G3_COERN|nr:dj-1 protein-like protein [Coemansia reversa NRRL 1564]|eukprot:PIA15323.1 dj-1 protein-like protein [Coemansia reversa NRRL 1564]
MASALSSKKAIVFVAQGSEEMETVIAVDVLRRAGIQVLVLAVEIPSGPVTCSRGVRLVPDAYLGDNSIKISTFDAVVVPGGAGGAEILSQNAQVRCILSDFHAQHKIVAAICAGALAIKTAGIQSHLSEPLRITSHPSVSDQLVDEFSYKEDRVVVDGNLVTSRGPGTALEFSLRLVSLLVGADKAREVAAPMVLNFSL